jgi:hypothetical protein
MRAALVLSCDGNSSLMRKAMRIYVTVVDRLSDDGSYGADFYDSYQSAAGHRNARRCPDPLRWMAWRGSTMFTTLTGPKTSSQGRAGAQ